MAQSPPARGISSLLASVAPELNGHSLGSSDQTSTLGGHRVRHRRSRHEISARSDTSFEDAAKSGLARANETLRGVKSALIKEQSVDVENGKIVAYRVNMLVTFVLE